MRDPALDTLRVLGLFSVTFRHNLAGEGQPLIDYIRNFLAIGGVPAFFILSGYLMAHKLRSEEVTLLDFTKKRFSTLMVPYLLWHLLIFSAIFALQAAGAGSLLSGQGHYLGIEPNLGSILSALFGIGRFPVIYQFWFLRDLIVASFAAFFLLRFLPPVPLMGWLLLFIPIPMLQSLGFFLIGVELRVFQPSGVHLSHKGMLIYCVSWIAFTVAIAFGHIEIPRPFLLLGNATLLYFIAKILTSSPWTSRLVGVGALTFFGFAAHEPLMTLVERFWLAQNIPGYHSVGGAVLVPLITLTIVWLLFVVLQRTVPGFLALLTGRR